jgi:hypothetical protein
MSDTYLIERLTQLLNLGYRPLPNKGKACRLPGWNKLTYVKDVLTDGPKGSVAELWPLRFGDCPTLGLRLDRGTSVIDIDVDDPLADRYLVVMAQIAPDVAAKAPTRYGGGTHKMALFVRCDISPSETKKLNGAIRSARYRRPGDGPDKHHVVEIFLSSPGEDVCRRQFGVYGAHTPDVVDYVWSEEPDPLHLVGPADLPLLTLQQAWDILAAFERLAGEAGWERLGNEMSAANAAFMFTIDESTRFEIQSGGEVGYADLSPGQRCTSSFHGDIGRNRTKCWVGMVNAFGVLGVWDHQEHAWFLPVSCAPVDTDALGSTLRDVAAEQNWPAPPPPQAAGRERAEQLRSGSRERPACEASWSEKVEWLLMTYGYCMSADTIVELSAASNDCELKREAFSFEFQAWYTVVKKEGKEKIIRAPAAWGVHPARASIKGVRMHPGQSFPAYWEGDGWYKNTYLRPCHPGEGGDVTLFLTFLERLIPDPIERAWLLDWMAHKWRHPAVPGIAIIFVADSEDSVRGGTFGTGRGLLFRIAHALYGPRYARAQSYNVLDGSSSQSAYNDWMQGSVLVTVDESRTSPTAYRRGERSAIYDVLKDIVDPAPKQHDFKGKYRRAFTGMSYCSFWVATNHADAIAIPEQDRRFTVLRNGLPCPRAEAKAIDAWMQQPENIGALARMLAERDLSGFDAYVPLMTAGKAAMAELAYSEVDLILRDFMADDERGLVFTRKHLAQNVERNLSVNNTRWQGDFEGAWSRYTVKAPSVTGDQQRTVRTEQTRKRLFCFRTRQNEARALPEAAARREAAKWGHIDGVSPGLVTVLGGPVTSGSEPKDE